jgi:tetratricopeptide (TPR) repeat protein
MAEAESAYRKAIELEPDAADTFVHLGHALKIQGKRDEAAAAYRRALTLDPALRAVLQIPDPAPRPAFRPHQHYIRTAHSTYLIVDRTSGRVRHGSEIDVSGVALFYFELAPNTNYGFFTTAGSLDRFVCGDVVALGDILPVRRTQLSANTVAFQQVARSSFLSAEGSAATNVVFDRDEAREWETYSLHRVRWELPQQRCALAGALVSLLGEPSFVTSHAAAVLSYQGSDQNALLAFCFDRLTMDEFVVLLDTLRTRIAHPLPIDCLLRRLLELRAASNSDTPFVPECLLQPGDAVSEFWVGHILADLMTWRRDRNRFLGPDRHVRLDTDLDFLHRLEPWISLASPGRLYNFIARFTTKPSRGICAVATARNEGVYLLEWLAYHKSIGIETFFIYSNDNDDGSDALLKRLSEAGAIHWMESIIDGDTAPQYKAYNHALNALPQILDYKWALFIDIDEFLVIDPDRFAGLTDYVAWQEQQPIDAIAFSWLQMSSSGLNKWSPDFVRNRFTQRLGLDRHIKSMFRPHRFLSSQPHFPITDRRVPVSMRDSSGYPHLDYYGGEQPAFLRHPKAEAAWINHYCFKSAEEYVWRRWRGVGDRKMGAELLTPDWLRLFATHHWSTAVVHDDRILGSGTDFQENYDTLLSISGVSELLARVQNNFCAILKNIIAELLNNTAFDHGDELLQLFFKCLSEEGGPCLPNDFDADTYLAIHKDVAERGVDAAVHYLTYGHKEARRLR